MLWTGRLTVLSGLGAISTGQLSEPSSIGSCLMPLGRSHADARTAARIELVIDAPVLAPSRINEHGITLLQAYSLLLQRLFQIGDCNLVVDRQDLHTLETRDVDQHPTRHQGADLLHAHLGEAAAARNLVHLHAVVEQPIDCLMGEAVELRADLTDLCNN